MSSRSLHRLLALTGLLLAVATPATAQFPPLTAPKGQLRLDLGGTLSTWDRQFRAGLSVDAAADFITDEVGSAFWPALRPGDSLLAKITGLSGGLQLGSTDATKQVYVGTASIGLAYGLTHKLTLFGTLPYRRVQVRSSLTHDASSATAGLNPADPTFGDGFGRTFDLTFFAQFDAALGALRKNLTDGAYNADPGRKQLAEQTLASATTLRADLFALLLDPATATPFLPTQGSTLGSALLQKVRTLQGTLSGLAVSGFSAVPALPAQALTSAQFSGFVTNPDGYVAGSLTSPTVSAIGDIELGAAYLLVDRPATGSGLGLRLAGQALVRLRTARLDRPDRFFDEGTGDRQPDVELGLAADVRQGRFGARLTGGYNLQLAGNQQRRIAPPSVPIPWASTLAAVTRTPGNEIRLGLQPFVALSRTLAITVGGRYTSKAGDTYELFEGQPEIPGAPVSLLAEDSKVSWVEGTAGLVYSAPFASAEDRPQFPLDAGLSYHTVVSASGGRVARLSEVRSFLRYYLAFP